MEPRKFSVHNQTRETALSESVTSVNAALEPLKVLKVLIEGLPENAKSGLWLTNFKGVPVARTLSPFDLVYLDKENRVILGVELSKDGEFTPPKGQPASALVLPPKSLSQSQTSAGDQLDFQSAAIEAPAPATAVAEQPAPAETSLPKEPVKPRATPAYSPHFFASLGATPAPPSEPGASGAQPSDPGSAVSPIPDILRPNDSAVNPFAFPDTPRSPLLRPPVESTPESIEPPESFSSKPVREPFWPKRLERSPVPASTAPVEEPQPQTEDSSAAPAPIVPIEEPPTQSPEPDQPRVRKQKYSWKVRLLRWLFPHLVIKDPEQGHERRRADRQSLPGLVAYYFTGGSPQPHKIANISVLGFYLQTDERWMPGTIVRMTLQRLGSTGEDPSDTITVNSRIVRWGSDGEGFEFILTDLED